MNSKEVVEGYTKTKLRRKIAGDGIYKVLPIPKTENAVADEVFLWRAVLDRALLDLTGNNLIDRVEVIEWLDTTNDHFKVVCECAMLDTEFVYNSMWDISELLMPEE